MATMDGTKPHVRLMGTDRADENGVILSMQSPKDVYKQLAKNPETELCYHADGVQLRVSGRIQEIADIALKKEITEKRTFYEPKTKKEGRGYVGAFILRTRQSGGHRLEGSSRGTKDTCRSLAWSAKRFFRQKESAVARLSIICLGEAEAKRQQLAGSCREWWRLSL